MGCGSDTSNTFTGNQSVGHYRIAFYNVENLFDTADAPAIRDEDFLPESNKHWNTARYQDKISKLATVIDSLQVPALIGLAEIENRNVLEDMISHPLLELADYKIIHFDSPDERGIDVALLYQPSFKPLRKVPVPVPFADGDKTRDVLWVKGLLKTDTIHIFVNHWPSRSGGKSASEPKRVYAASVVRNKIDSISQASPAARLIIMGDFNDEPDDKSMGMLMNAQSGPLFNTMSAFQKAGLGSYCFRDQWDMLDQIIISETLNTQNNHELVYEENSATIFSPDWLRQPSGKYKGYPDRTYAGNQYLGGYSDHFPVFIDLKQDAASDF